MIMFPGAYTADYPYPEPDRPFTILDVPPDGQELLWTDGRSYTRAANGVFHCQDDDGGHSVAFWDPDKFREQHMTGDPPVPTIRDGKWAIPLD